MSTIIILQEEPVSLIPCQPKRKSRLALGTQVLLSIVDRQVVQHDHTPSHCEISAQCYMQLQEDHIPSKVHRVKHSQPLNRTKDIGQQNVSSKKGAPNDTHGSWPFHLNSSPRLTMVGTNIATAPPSDLYTRALNELTFGSLEA